MPGGRSAAGLLMNTLTHFDFATGKEQSWFCGPKSSLQEVCFIPKSGRAAEGEGYLTRSATGWTKAAATSWCSTPSASRRARSRSPNCRSACASASTATGRQRPRRSLIEENHRLRPVHQHAILDVVVDSAREHPPFDVTALAHQACRRVGMADGLDVLGDDRALVEVGRSHSAPSRRSASRRGDAPDDRARAFEAGQEAVVDVDAAPVQLGRQLGRQDLHVAREHDQFGLAVVNDLPDLRFLLRPWSPASPANGGKGMSPIG